MGKTTDFKTGWLSPTGEFIPCISYDHVSMAQEIYNTLTGSTDMINCPDEKLLNDGWVQISIVYLLDHGYSCVWYKHLTPEQIRFLKPYYEGEYGLKMIKMCAVDYEFEIDRK